MIGACVRGLAVFALVTTLGLPAAQTALAQDQVSDPYPLRPADTSSPRDTLRSFLRNATRAIQDWRGDDYSAASDRAFLRAVETLDLSTTPDYASWAVRLRRVLLLKDILDRVAVPPYDEIPGTREVADDGITQWTVPDTSITIKRIDDGPRADEFLFSADTVARLDRLYRHARHLPYKPGAEISAYEEFVESNPMRDRRVRARLRGVDTSNPRATLLGFLNSVNNAYAIVMEADVALRDTPPTMTKAQALEMETRADQLMTRATDTLDLSKVPATLRRTVGIETALKLKEILDRMLLPPVDAIPDAAMVEAARAGESGSFLPTAGPLRWQFPDTQIEIVEIMEGEGEGQFLFSSESIAKIRRYYKEISDLPYISDQRISQSGDYEPHPPSEDFFEFYISNPGYLVPRAHFLGDYLSDLPDWLATPHYGNPMWQWIATILCVLATALAAYAVFRVVWMLAAPLRSPLDAWSRVLAPALVALIVVAVAQFIYEDISLTGSALIAMNTGARGIVLALLALLVFGVCNAVADTIITSPRIPEGSIDASLLRISARVIGILAGVWIFVDGIRGLGADIIPLIASLGVGGLAVALAAQKTLANFIGSVILFSNKPVKVGDFCRFGDEMGTVEEIGLHSTRIRTLQRTILNVPNADFSEMQLDNYSLRDERLLRTVLQLRYETTPEQMRYLLAKLRELLLGHPMVTPDPARVRFVGFGAYSLDVEVFAYLRCQDQNRFLAVQEDILLRMADIVTEAGTGFAFPSQTTYFTRASGVDAERRGEAEAEVAQWRARGQLPFPEFEEETRERLADNLDYPPKGSPEYTPPVALAEPEPEPTPQSEPGRTGWRLGLGGKRR